MKAIATYRIPDRRCEVEMRKGAQILEITSHNYHAYAVALIDDEQPMEKRRFAYFNTLEALPAGDYYKPGAYEPGNPGTSFLYLGSTHDHINSNYIFHVFEVIK